MAMTWTTFHRRGDVLRTVTEVLDARRDGVLPMGLPGVAETFGSEHDLLAALLLRWHTRLSGHLERALMAQPAHPDRTVLEAWHATADELPGIRAAIEHYRDEPRDEQMALALATSAAKEHLMLGAMAGRHGATPAQTAAAGRLLAEQARSTYRPRGVAA
jgi:hypothetical protein